MHALRRLRAKENRYDERQGTSDEACEHAGGAPPLAAETQIRTATLADLKFVDHVQRKFGNALGYLPTMAFESLLADGHIRLCQENDAAAGYILSRPRLRWQPLMRSITQAAVLMDAQRRHHGLALLAQIEAESRAAGLLAIQACCAVGLESNEFWRAAGFRPIVHMTPQNVRAREIICWRKPLADRLPAWFAMPPKLAGHHPHKVVSDRDPMRSVEDLEEAQRFLSPRQARSANATISTHS